MSDESAQNDNSVLADVVDIFKPKAQKKPPAAVGSAEGASDPSTIWNFIGVELPDSGDVPIGLSQFGVTWECFPTQLKGVVVSAEDAVQLGVALIQAGYAWEQKFPKTEVSDDT